MSRTCPFCEASLEIDGPSAGTIDVWVCPLCGYRETLGLDRLPDPDLLRGRAEDLEKVADQLEESELGRYLSRWKP